MKKSSNKHKTRGDLEVDQVIFLDLETTDLINYETGK